jgi:2-keto-4-pentenoate hydratase/2-oxohepta-3-ene-1,7-dioic acid hydratase in catechol pathway
MRRIQALLVLLVLGPMLGSPAPLTAQGGPATRSVEPFKVGTFDIGGVPQVGLVLRDRLVVDLRTANTALEVDPAYPKIQMPADMLELIGAYEYGLKFRLYEIVNHLVATGQLDRARPAYVYDVGQLRIRPPMMYPGKILNAAVNFFSHVNEAGTAAEREAAMKQRREQRGVPYLFLKPSRGVVIGASDTIVLPYGRDRMDWEVELGAVIGRAGKYISAREAQDHVFGYMVSVDVSDRGGRPPGGFGGGGTDWFVGKGHDTAAPEGPWIVPKEFYGDPMTKLRQRLTVDGKVLQDAEAGDMIHTLWELIEYGSSIVTLYPGDVVNNGTSGGTAAGTTTRGTDPFLKAGEVIEASVDGIGTMRLHVRSEPEPKGLTGAQLPPVGTYRRPER